MKRRLVFDLEADSLEPTKLYVLSYSYTDEEEVYSTGDYEEMREVMTREDTEYIGHRIRWFDIPVLERLLPYKHSDKSNLIDTLPLSWYLYPRRIIHGLDEWGNELGVKKPHVDNWENLSYEEARHRCEEDVKINKKLWFKMQRDLNTLYDGDDKTINRIVKYLNYKVDCVVQCEQDKIKLDWDLTEQTLEKLEPLATEKRDCLSTVMPKVPIKAKRTFPANPFKKNGDRSIHGENWLKLLEERGLPADHKEPIEVITGYREPNPGSSPQVKDWLFSLGWEPEHFKHVRNKDTGDVRKIPQIKHEFEDGELCPSIVRLAEDIPEIEHLAGLSMIEHRMGILKAFREAVDDDGFIHMKIGGFTNTLRLRHNNPIVNLPKVGVPWGEEIRSCLVAREGYEFCGSDQSSLEDRTKLHYMYEYDPEYVKEMSVPGFDPHLDLALTAGELSEEQVQAHKDGREDHKDVRHVYNTTNYSCTYGAGAEAIARAAKCSVAKGKKLHKVYWERNWSIKRIADDALKKPAIGLNWIYNPVSGFWYWLKTQKDAFSTLNQSTGVYCFDRWIMEVRKVRPQLSLQYHDEILIEIKLGHRKQCIELLRSAMLATNKRLNLNRELDIGIEFGANYAEVH